jgi:hypothetical protein
MAEKRADGQKRNPQITEDGQDFLEFSLVGRGQNQLHFRELPP